MEQRQPIFRLSLGAKGAIAILLLAVSGGAILTSCNPNTPETTVPTTQPTNPVKNALTPTPKADKQTATVEIYSLEDKDGKLQIVPRPITIEQKATNQQAILEQAFNRLLAQSAIPQGTKLRSIKVDKDSITVDLSPEFTSGGGSLSMTQRLGEVIYTATTLNPKSKVFLNVNGKPLDYLGGEGLEVTQPITRESFNKAFLQ
ncbi:MAG TPA: GerMN domain-containing protein [Phormidium sp.]